MDWTQALSKAERWARLNRARSASANAAYTYIINMGQAKAMYGKEGESVQLRYIISNLGTWRDPEAKEAKVALKARIAELEHRNPRMHMSIPSEMTPARLTRLGERVRIYFEDDPATNDYGPKYEGIKRISKAQLLELAKADGVRVYTGIHRENDWSRTYNWVEGWHFVNRTGDYAIVRESALMNPMVGKMGGARHFHVDISVVTYYPKELTQAVQRACRKYTAPGSPIRWFERK